MHHSQRIEIRWQVMRIVFNSWRGGVGHPRISILIPSRLNDIPFQSLTSPLHLISAIRDSTVPSSYIIILARDLAHRITLDERVVEIFVIPVHHSPFVRSLFEVVQRALIIWFVVERAVVRIQSVGLASDHVHVEIRPACLASGESGLRGSGQGSIPVRGVRVAVHTADRGGLRRSQVKIEIRPDGEGILAFAGGC